MDCAVILICGICLSLTLPPECYLHYRTSEAKFSVVLHHLNSVPFLACCWIVCFSPSKQHKQHRVIVSMHRHADRWLCCSGVRWMSGLCLHSCSRWVLDGCETAAHGEHHSSAQSCPLGGHIAAISWLFSRDYVMLCILDPKDCFCVYSESMNEIPIYKVSLNMYQRSQSLLRKVLVMSRGGN